MPNRAHWDAGYACGHDLIDAQHQALLAQCRLLADLCLPDGTDGQDARFDAAFVQLQTLVREHFEAEAELLARQGWMKLEDHRFECDEFEVLVSDIVSTEHFDRLELQRFLTLWCIGHIVGSARSVRTALGTGAPSG